MTPQFKKKKRASSWFLMAKEMVTLYGGTSKLESFYFPVVGSSVSECWTCVWLPSEEIFTGRIKLWTGPWPSLYFPLSRVSGLWLDRVWVLCSSCGITSLRSSTSWLFPHVDVAFFFFFCTCCAYCDQINPEKASVQYMSVWSLSLALTEHQRPMLQLYPLSLPLPCHSYPFISLPPSYCLLLSPLHLFFYKKET